MVLSLFEDDTGFHLICDPVSRNLERRKFSSREHALAVLAKYRSQIPKRDGVRSECHLDSIKKRERDMAISKYKAERMSKRNERKNY